MNSNKNSEDPNKTIIIKEFSKEEKARLDQIRDYNLEAIEHLENTLSEQKKVSQKQLLIKLSIYLIEIIILILITSQISNVFLAIFISLIGSIIMTYTIDLIMKKIKKKKEIGDMGEVKRDYKRDLISQIISNFSIMPPIIRNNIVSICYKGKTTKASADVLKMRSYKKIMEEFLTARKHFRDMEFIEANDLLKHIIKKSKHHKELIDLQNEAMALLEITPVISS